MHTGSSTINVPIDCDVKATGTVLRGQDAAPRQRFVPARRHEIKTGDWLLNPTSAELHRVLETDAEAAVLSTAIGPLVVAWEDIEESTLRVAYES